MHRKVNSTASYALGLARVSLWLGLVCTSGPARAAVPVQPTPSPPCPPREQVGWWGITGLECDCTYTLDRESGASSWEFRGEPRVLSVASDGPAAGRLQEGDVVFAVDDDHITAAAAGAKIARPKPGTPVEFTVRRDGQLKTVAVTPRAVCPDDPRLADMTVSAEPTVPGAVTRPGVPTPTPSPSPPALASAAPAPAPAAPELAPALPTTPSPPAPPAAPALAPRPGSLLPGGWMGLSISCSDCSISSEGKAGATPVWRFRSSPIVYAVEPGSPAEQSGLLRGDVLTAIDGIRMDSREGGARFGALKPGEPVRWTVRRGAKTQQVVVVALPRPGEPVAPKTPRPELPDAEHLRYAGEVAGAEIEVRGSSSVVVTIDDDGQDVVISTLDATIRIRSKSR